MNYFKTFIEEPIKYGKIYGDTGIPIPLKKLSKFTNYVQKGQSICIGGKPESGKTSMMDYNYFISLFIWWQEQDPVTRPKLKMIYFSMKHPLKTKIQKWLCLYLKLKYSIMMDIPTLNNGVGKLRELTQDDLDKITLAEEFFAELFEDTLSIQQGAMQPTGIYNRVNSIMSDYGKMDKDTKVFTYHKEYERMITIVYVETLNHVLTENDGYAMLNDNDIKKKVSDYLTELRRTYNLTTVVIAPSKLMMTRMVKETEPTYKETGTFGANADLTIVMYNPFNEANNSFLNYPVKDFVFGPKNRFRTATIVRNTSGVTNVTVGLLFLGESGYLAESPSPNDEANLLNRIEILSQLD